MFNIIIPAFNKLEYSIRCVESVLQFTETGMFDIWFINDGSTDGTEKWAKDMVRKRSDFHYLFNITNSGFVHSSNRAVRFALGSNNRPYVLILNNDVILLSWWVNDAMELLKDPKIAIIGADGHKEIDDKILYFISGSRMIVKRGIIEKFGMFDPNFKFGYWEDVEFSWRVQGGGYKIKKFEMPSTHARGVSFVQNKMKGKYFAENRQYLIDKISKQGGVCV